jgi:hypothetical protein
MKPTEKLIKSLVVALEITGTTLSDGAVKVMLADLSAYPEPQVMAALRRCCRELKGKLTLADILSRIEDGRPSPEEAWAIVPKDEASSAVITQEMREAFAVAYPMVAAGELIQARMAFLERYRVLVQQARDARTPVQWTFTPGTDCDGRELVLLDAAEKGRISVEGVQALLPYHRESEGLSARLLSIAGREMPKLQAPEKQQAA